MISCVKCSGLSAQIYRLNMVWPLFDNPLLGSAVAQWKSAWLETERLKVRASPASLHCGPWARHIYPSLVLVQPRKTCLCLTERLLMGRKESNQTNKQPLVGSLFQVGKYSIYYLFIAILFMETKFPVSNTHNSWHCLFTWSAVFYLNLLHHSR